MTAEEKYWHTAETELVAYWLECWFNTNPEVKHELSNIRNDELRKHYLEYNLKFNSSLGRTLIKLAFWQKYESQTPEVCDIDELLDVALDTVDYDVLVKHFFHK
jgi:hypothetical protein